MGHGYKDVFHSQKNQDDLYGKDRTGKKQEIREQKNDAAPDLLVAFVIKQKAAEPEKKFRHMMQNAFTRPAEVPRGLRRRVGLLFKQDPFDKNDRVSGSDVAVEELLDDEST
jgi:hypothetical protein